MRNVLILPSISNSLVNTRCEVSSISLIICLGKFFANSSFSINPKSFFAELLAVIRLWVSLITIIESLTFSITFFEYSSNAVNLF